MEKRMRLSKTKEARRDQNLLKEKEIEMRDDAIVGWDSTRKGLNHAFNELYTLKNFNKTNYLKSKT